MTKSDLDRALDRAASFSPDVREVGRQSLDALFQGGCAEAGLELARIVVSEGFACSLGKPEAVRLLIEELRQTGSAGAFLDLYYYGGDEISDEAMLELLTLAAPNCTEAAEILEARLPSWRHPLA
jgi:hypothetical protein